MNKQVRFSPQRLIELNINKADVPALDQRPISISSYSRSKFDAERIAGRLVYAGYNQVTNSTTLLLATNFLYELHLANDEKFVFYLKEDGKIDTTRKAPTEATYKATKVISLRDPVLDGWKQPQEELADEITETRCDCESPKEVKEPIPEYEVVVGYELEDVRFVDVKLHQWMFKKLVAEDKLNFGNFNGDTTYKVLEVLPNNEVRLLTNYDHPKRKIVMLNVTIGERHNGLENEAIITEVNRVSVATSYVLTPEEQAEEDARMQQMALERKAEDEAKEALAAKFEVDKAELLSRGDFPRLVVKSRITNISVARELKVVYINKCLAEGVPLFGHWDGETRYRNTKLRNGLVLPDFRVVGFNDVTHEMVIECYNDNLDLELDNYYFGVALMVNIIDTPHGITNWIGAYPMSREHFDKDYAIFTEQQELLKTL